jgi:tRNA A-37 threonylcarbamoyl transferase component Bud32
MHAMANPLFIERVPDSTPAALATAPGRLRALPDDLLREASRRLGIMSLLGGGLWMIATVLDHVAMSAMGLENSRWNQFVATDAIAAASVIISLALFFYTRRDHQHPRFILDLGLVYMVLTSLALGLVIHWDPVSGPFHVFPMITWVGAVILMFAAIVPNAPAKTLIAGLVAASMNPLGMLIAIARGSWDFATPGDVLLMHYPDYLLVGVAVVISHVVTRLSQQVTKAREMGSYQLITMLGKGGMGEVWRARHRMLARDAAIKLIQPEVLDRSSRKNAALMRRRFEQEAKSTALLRSPHTVELYDFGVSNNGVFYYVMELLDGIDLETLVRRFGAQPPARVVYILRQVCRSLADAHRHGMIHRDIKPTNIFLCRMGTEYDFAKVLDFGLVKLLESNEPQMTAENAMTGTPAYMAPELALGSSLIDGRTDLYGLGCVAYWLITGKLVFEENGAAAMMLAHLQKVPIRASIRSEFAVPDSLDRAIMMCLAKEPAERPAGAAILARMLDGCSDAGSWTPDDAELWWQTHMPEHVTPLENEAVPAPKTASAFPTQ